MIKKLWAIMLITIFIILAIFFYASIFFPITQTPKVVEETAKSASDLIKKQDSSADIIIFAFKKKNPYELEKIILENQGMQNLAKLNQDLQSENYIEVLKALWSEKNTANKLHWLKEKEPESHPILLFELATTLFEQSPSKDTLEESLYLLELAKYRTKLDAICIKDSSTLSAAETLYNNYASLIAEIIDNTPSLKQQLSPEITKKMNIAILEKLLISLKQIQQKIKELPSPKWLSKHALKTLFITEDLNFSKKKCIQKQQRAIKNFINHVTHQLHLLTSPIPSKPGLKQKIH